MITCGLPANRYVVIFIYHKAKFHPAAVHNITGQWTGLQLRKLSLFSQPGLNEADGRLLLLLLFIYYATKAAQ